MKKILDYKIVKGIETYEKSFEREIKQLKEKGYKTLGKMKVHTIRTEKGMPVEMFTQLMVLYE